MDVSRSAGQFPKGVLMVLFNTPKICSYIGVSAKTSIQKQTIITYGSSFAWLTANEGLSVGQ
jgi:hypothetical protein